MPHTHNTQHTSAYIDHSAPNEKLTFLPPVFKDLPSVVQKSFAWILTALRTKPTERMISQKLLRETGFLPSCLLPSLQRRELAAWRRGCMEAGLNRVPVVLFTTVTCSLAAVAGMQLENPQMLVPSEN